MSEQTTRISPEAEQRLVRAVSESIQLVNAGADPDNAIAKVASDNYYGPDFVSRMVEMYNNSRTLAHYKHAAAEHRGADFPIASTDKTLEIMFPDPPAAAAAATKAAGHDFMTIKPDHTPVFEKAAHYLHDGDALIKRALNRQEDLRRASASARTDLEAARQARQRAVMKLATYFRRPGHVGFPEAHTRAQAHYGKAGDLIMKAAHEQLGVFNTKIQQGAPPTRRLLCDRSKEPYSLIDAAIKASELVAEKSAALQDREGARKAFETALRDRFQDFRTKEAKVPLSFSHMLSAGLGSAMARQGNAEVVKRTLEEMSDPVHEAKLNSIRTEAMLQDLMVNDPVISKYDPSDVIDAYTAVSQMAPKAAMQPAIVRGYLRRMLEGSDVLEPFEIQQLAATEKGIAAVPESPVEKLIEKQQPKPSKPEESSL